MRRLGDHVAKTEEREMKDGNKIERIGSIVHCCPTRRTRCTGTRYLDIKVSLAGLLLEDVLLAPKLVLLAVVEAGHDDEDDDEDERGKGYPCENHC